jgi:copper chaperone CopZ
MKFLKIFILFLILGTGTAHAQFTKAELQVSGLTCSMCSKATEKALRTLEFVGDIKTDLNHNVFMITFKSGSPVNLGQISKKVQNAGFSVNNLKATFNFSGVKLNSNSFSYQGDTYMIINGVNKPLTGPVAITVVDKGFAPSSVYKKYAGQNLEGVKTGKLYRVAI